MKKTLLAVMVSAAFITTAAQAAGTIANNGTLHINGMINAAPATTCNLEISSGGIATSVELDAVLVDTFNEVGSATDSKAFTLAFTSCPAAMADNSSAQLTLKGTKDSNNENVFQNSGTATGIGVQIQETTGTASNMIPDTLNTEGYTVTGGAFNVPLQANIVRTSPEGTAVTAGVVAANAVVQIDYQ